MSDLISRSEVLKIIDENGYYSVNSQIGRIRQNVVEMPTAFDLDKVIEELEIERDNYGRCAIPTLTPLIGVEFGIKKAIKIIKKYLSDNSDVEFESADEI